MTYLDTPLSHAAGARQWIAGEDLEPGQLPLEFLAAILAAAGRSVAADKTPYVNTGSRWGTVVPPRRPRGGRRG